jgi:YVTN family beta-propeller protein
VRLAVVSAALFFGALPAVADEAFITEQGGGAVSVLDLSTRKIVARMPVEGKPAGIGMAHDGRFAYVTSPEGKFVSVIDTAARQVVRRIDMPDAPLGIAVDPRGAFLYVAGFYQPRLYKIDLAKGAIVATLTIGASPSGVALTQDGATIVTADRDDNQISIIDAASFTRRAVVKVGRHPFGVTIDAEGRRIYTANVESDDVSVVDLHSPPIEGKGAGVGSLVATVPVGKRPYAVALAQGKGFVTDQYGGTVSVFDLATLQPLKRIDVGEYPEGIETSADGTIVYVANWFSNEVFAIDAETLKVAAKMPVGDGPRSFGTFLRVTR